MKYFCLIFMLLPLSCYEDWEYSKTKPQLPLAGEAPVAKKPYSYVLFQPIFPSPEAVKEPKCQLPFARSMTYEEWKLRVTKIAEGLQKQSEQFYQNHILISPQNCADLGTNLSVFALSQSPWLPNPAPSVDSLGRPILHIKAVFWDEDLRQPTNLHVIQTDWSAFAKLKQQGMNIKSLHYFNLPTQSMNFFGSWVHEIERNAPSQLFFASYVNPSQAQNASAEGLLKRTQTIEMDTSRFLEWVQGEARK